jgi:hypothetical protein
MAIIKENDAFAEHFSRDSEGLEHILELLTVILWLNIKG